MWRRRLTPKCYVDLAAIVFLLTMIPIVYWFEVFCVMPRHFESSNILYLFNAIIATFLLINVVGNFVAVFLIDTSIERRFLSSELKPKWKFCEICECVTPPRSWHCHVCNICILKRDHHCVFTSSCIGHFNHRYFIMFVFYLIISSIYCLYFNTQYLWTNTKFNIIEILKIVFPFAALTFANDKHEMHMYRIITMLSIIAALTGSLMFIYHIRNMCHGLVSYESGKNIKDYDLGSVKENIIVVFGNRWYLTWLLPFFNSELPNDGINWDKIKQRTNKSK